MKKENDAEQYFLIIDLEATCVNDGSIPRDETEIIEIGAVLALNKDTEFTEVSSFTTFINPVKHNISLFCTELTSITQNDVDSAPVFTDAYDNLITWIDGLGIESEIKFCSWGNYDKNQLIKECSENNVQYPFTNHTNIKNLFKSVQKIKRPVGMAKALKLAKLEISGTHHRGIDDARNMVQLLPFIFGKSMINR